MSGDKIPKAEAPASKANSMKRTRDDDVVKRKKRKTGYEQDDTLLDTELGLNTGIALMDSQLMADHLVQRTTRFGSDLSSVEMADLYIPPGSIHDTTSWQEPRILEKLPDFLEKYSKDAKDLAKAPKQKGAPHTIIVAGAGLRAADIVRALRKYQTKENSVAKLFAKHIKIDESIQFLKSHKTGLAVGTPQRLSDLVENGALSLANLERLVIDASHIDQKKRGILDMKEITLPLTRWLARPEMRERYTAEEKPLKLLFY